MDDKELLLVMTILELLKVKDIDAKVVYDTHKRMSEHLHMYRREHPGVLPED